jgi:hypothetical protein
VGRGIGLLIGLGIAAALTAGCGGASNLTATDFINGVNEEGVEIKLGEELSRTGGRELYAVQLVQLPGHPEPAPGTEEHEHEQPGSGTLYIFDDSGAAEQQMDACRGSAGLTCYRAQNMVVLFEEVGLEEQRLAVAMNRLDD